MLGTAAMLLLAGCGGGATGGGAVSGGEKAALGAGSAVVAEWGGNGNWYEGKINKACDGGFEVAWSDGSEASCIPAASVVADVAVSASDVQVGKAVLARQEGAQNYYSGKVTAVEGASYSVATDGGIVGRGITLSNLRLK